MEQVILNVERLSGVVVSRGSEDLGGLMSLRGSRNLPWCCYSGLRREGLRWRVDRELRWVVDGAFLRIFGLRGEMVAGREGMAE
jgi:hypothetical protein